MYLKVDDFCAMQNPLDGPGQMEEVLADLLETSMVAGKIEVSALKSDGQRVGSVGKRVRLNQVHQVRRRRRARAS